MAAPWMEATLPTRDLAVRVMHQQRVALQAELRLALEAFKTPIAGSPRAIDQTWISTQDQGRREEALNGVLGAAAVHVVEILRVTDEHSVALEVLLMADEILPVPMTALVRSIHEALLEVCWSADPALTSEQRMARAAAVSLAGHQGNLGPLNDIPNSPVAHIAQVKQAVQGTQSYLEQHGYTLRYNQSGTIATSVTYGSSLAALKTNATDASRRYMPGSHHMWSLGSGATHSRNWFTGGLEGSRSMLAIMAVAPLLDFTDAAVDNIHGYFGLPTSGFHQGAHLRRRVLLARDEGGPLGSVRCGYDEYAANRDQPYASLGPARCRAAARWAVVAR